jgi:hypothetical protein
VRQTDMEKIGSRHPFPSPPWYLPKKEKPQTGSSEPRRTRRTRRELSGPALALVFFVSFVVIQVLRTVRKSPSLVSLGKTIRCAKFPPPTFAQLMRFGHTPYQGARGRGPVTKRRAEQFGDRHFAPLNFFFFLVRRNSANFAPGRCAKSFADWRLLSGGEAKLSEFRLGVRRNPK